MIIDRIWSKSKICQEAEAAFYASLFEPEPKVETKQPARPAYTAAADELNGHHPSAGGKQYVGRGTSKRTQRIIQIIKDSPIPISFLEIQDKLGAPLNRSAITRLLNAGVISVSRDDSGKRSVLRYSFAT